MMRDGEIQDALSHYTTYDTTSMRTAKDTEPTRHTTVPSTVRACTAREVEIGQYPIPQIQGVVPGIRRFRHAISSSPSPSHAHSLVSPLSTANPVSANNAFSIQNGTAVYPNPAAALQITHSTSSRRSNYPRASPPVFLYPFPIVPYTVAPPAQPSTEHTHCVYTEQPHPSTSAPSPSPMQRSDASLAASLPISLKVIFLITLAVILLGVLWSIITFCILFPPGRWKMFQTRQPGSNVVEPTEARRDDSIEMQVVDDEARDAGDDVPLPSEAIRRPAHASQEDDAAANPFASSPYNPFLDPPAARAAGVQRPRRAHKARSSREWKEAHAAFFGAAGDAAKSSVVDASKTVERKVHGKEAVEDGRVKAQKEDGGEKENGKDASDKGSGEDTLTAKGVKWVNETLGMLDGAVDEAAAGIARLTDEKVD